MATTTNDTIVLPEHIFRPSGSCKTICVTAVLTSLGIPVGAFKSTSTKRNVCAYEGVIRRNGFALRSRKSSIPKGATVGSIRKTIAQKFTDPLGTRYVVLVRGHLLMLDDCGKTIVDTSPRVRDHRAIVRIHAVWKR